MVYLNHDSTDANFNFALEKYAMEQLDIADEYFMFWRTVPTLMIGCYQNTLREINMSYARENNINIIRRITGGGTIYTDLNGWQFSFIIKKSGERNIDFSAFTKPILDALCSLGVDAQTSGRNDLVIDGRKFSGNAQYSRKNVVLHHGSLLFGTDLEVLVHALNVDNEKIISKGIKSVRQRVTNISEHIAKKMTSEEFRDAMLSYLLKDMDSYTLSQYDINKINEIKRNQFDTWEWNFGHDPKFNITKENRFAGGKLTVQSYVESGRIINIHFYGDFFAHEGLTDLEKRLKGCRYEKNSIRKVLESSDAGNCLYQITLDEILSCII